MVDRPVRASRHCRHYSYERGFSGGPHCAKGVDLSAPGSEAPCMPDPETWRTYTGPCPQREDYTDAERAAWKAWTDERMARIPVAIAALGEPIPLRSERTVACPLCDGGTFRASRAGNGHVWLGCSTPDCLGPIHLNIDSRKEWP